jgi:hypothetical protein
MSSKSRIVKALFMFTHLMCAYLSVGQLHAWPVHPRVNRARPRVEYCMKQARRPLVGAALCFSARTQFLAGRVSERASAPLGAHLAWCFTFFFSKSAAARASQSRPNDRHAALIKAPNNANASRHI